MKNAAMMCLLLLGMHGAGFAQNTQTVRGKITDDVSKTPLVGVNVVVVGVGETPLGSTTLPSGAKRGGWSQSNSESSRPRA